AWAPPVTRNSQQSAKPTREICGARMRRSAGSRHPLEARFLRYSVVKNRGGRMLRFGPEMARETSDLRRSIDWGSLSPLRIRARMVAEGVWAGAHRSARKGAGVEFGGHRAYTPGDDLRHLDVRSLLRHDHLLVREFETETDRALRIVVDATASMGYRGKTAPGDKLAFSSLVAAALARIAIRSGDPVSLGFVGGTKNARAVPVSGGREAFERVIDALESQRAEGDALADTTQLDRALGALAR